MAAEKIHYQALLQIIGIIIAELLLTEHHNNQFRPSLQLCAFSTTVPQPPTLPAAAPV
jgi:hypothetical protein